MESGPIIMVGQLSEKGKKINLSTFSGPKPGLLRVDTERRFWHRRSIKLRAWKN